MIQNNLFERHLMATTLLNEPDTPLLDEEVQEWTDVLTTFAANLDDSDDLGEHFEAFCQINIFSEDEAASFQNALIGITEQTFGEATDDHIKSFLKTLNQPYPKATQTTPNQSGNSPQSGELAVRRFLQSLTVDKHANPYGKTNDDAFSAKDVKTFDRIKNRYGHPYKPYNNQRPSRPLANPSINVDINNRAFECVDAIGLGNKMHYRVVNRITNEFVSKQMEKTQAEAMAAELNFEYRKVLDEHIAETGGPLDEGGMPTRKHFEQVAATVKAIEDPKQRQHFADHHAAIFAKANPRFDHARWHAACGTQHVNKEAYIPSLKIQENLLKPADPRYAQYLERMNANFTMSGSLAQSDHSINHASEWKKTAQLINERKAKFEENEASEQDALWKSSRTIRGLRK
jgi:hypothetical protein